MTSRVRCSCGRIYDPVKHAQCPECGAESAVESVVVAEKVKAPAPPEPKPAPAKGPGGLLSPLASMPWPMVAAGAALILGILFFALRHRGQTVGQVSRDARPPAPSTEEKFSPRPGATATPGTEIPSGGATFPSGGGTIPGVSSGILSELVASAGQGGTVKLRPGFYQGGVILNKAVRIVGDAPGGQVIVQSEGKECLTVRTKGVFVQNVYFVCNGIGELPGISVAEGADLEMEGCKVQSGSALGLSVVGNATFKALGSSFSANNGAAVRVNQAHASFTQCTFSDAKVGLMIASAGGADLHACAFERTGMSDANGAIMTVSGDKSQVAGDDCHFTGNSGGINVADKGSLSLMKCSFKDNAKSSRGAASAGLVVLRNSAHGEIRNTNLADASPYAINVMSGATLLMEDSEITGCRTAGLVVGEEGASPAHADVKRSQFARNSTGIGIFAGGSADITDSECRENNEGIVVVGRGSHVQITKTALLANRDHGLYVYGEAEANGVDLNIQGNARGAQSGMPRKGSTGGSLALQDCHVTSNQVFGVGAYAKSQLTLTRVTFEANGKTNIYREGGAIVETEGSPDASPAQAATTATPEKDGTESHKSAKAFKKQRRQSDDDARRIMRRFFRP